MAKVFLSAGHGGKDPGAVANGLKEKDVVLDIMLACRDELKRNGVTVYTSRTRDENDPVEEEVKEANRSGAEVSVSFHANAGRGDGSETYYYSSDKKGKRLAELCEAETKKIGQNSRGVKSGNGLWWIRKTNMTAVLCECAFVDNKKDKSIIDTKEERRKFGVAYAKAILKYLDVEYSKPTPKPTTPKPSSKYYKRYTGNSGSIVVGLNAIGVDSSFSNRRKIAKKNGISVYMGTASQNIKLLNLLKQGKLKK